MNSTNCPCDFVLAPRLAIHAGLSNLSRQLATFPEFRALMLGSPKSEHDTTGLEQDIDPLTAGAATTAA